jgi:hypothetical protein
MKKIPGWLVCILAIVGVGGYFVLSQGTSVVYENKQEPANETEVVETPDCMQVMNDEDACAAAQDVIKRKELEAESARLDAEVKALTETYNTEVERLEARQLEIEKELGF